LTSITIKQTQKKNSISSDNSKSSADGEDALIQGIGNQYLAAAELIYNAFTEEDFSKIILKCDSAGQVDDLVLVRFGRVDAYQMKWSDPPRYLTYREYKKNLKLLHLGREELKRDYHDCEIFTHLYTNNIASQSKIKSIGPFSRFMQEFWNASDVSDEIISKWKLVSDELKSDLNIVGELDEYRPFLRFDLNRKSPENREEYNPSETYYIDIYTLKDIFWLAVKKRGTIELDRREILKLAGWETRAEFISRHFFETPDYYQPIENTVEQLKSTISNTDGGYIALIGSPGSGKSTLLTKTLRYTPKSRVIPYYCFVPDDTSIQPRSEAKNFLHDLVLSLKQKDVGTKNLIPGESLEQLREEFKNQLHELELRYQESGIKTIILIDGLDHIKREGNPVRSLVHELPNPSAVPEGVLFVLGSQYLDQLELKYEIFQQLKSRKIEMDMLPKKAIRKISKSGLPHLELESKYIEKIYEISSGHPLHLNYIINKTKGCASINQLDDILEEFSPYEDNIEDLYERYWRSFENEEALLELLALLSRIRGYLDLHDINKLAYNDGVIRKLKDVTGHYFKEVSPFQWAFFHNSFRQFILNKTGRNPFDIDDPDKHKDYHRKLANTAVSQPDSSTFRWEVLYHQFHAEEYQRVIETGQQKYFREQFINGRCFKSIVDDINLVMRAAKESDCPLAVIRMLLIYEELSSRAGILDDIDFPILLLNVEKIDEAISHVFKDEKLLVREYKALEFAAKLYDIGHKEVARKIFIAAEPLDKIEGTSRQYYPYAGEDILDEWLYAAIRFRPLDELVALIARFEIDEWRRRSENREESNKKLRLTYYISLIDYVVELGDFATIENLSQVLAGYMESTDVKKRVAWNIINSPETSPTRKEEYFDVLLEDTSWEEFNNQEKITYCEFLLNEKKNIKQAGDVFATILPPAPLKEYNINSGAYRYYKDLFRYHRLNSTLATPINPDLVIPSTIDPDHQGVKNVGRMVVIMANTWGTAWKGTPLAVDDFVRTISPAVELYENYQSPNSSVGLILPLLGFHQDYLKMLVHAARISGKNCLEELQKIFVERWEDEKKGKIWLFWVRRLVSKLMYDCGLYQSNFSQIFENLEEEELILSPEKDLREFLDACKIRVSDWHELGESEKSYTWIKRMISESFGIIHEKDIQINEWADLFGQILLESPQVVKEDFRRMAAGIATNAKYNRARYSSDSATSLLSSITFHNAESGRQLKNFYWDEGVLEFLPTTEALIAAAVKNPNISPTLPAVLYRRLYLPYEVYTNVTIVKHICDRLCTIEDKAESIKLLRYFISGIDQETPEDTRGAIWSVFAEAFDSTAGQEHLLNEVLPFITKQKPRIEHTPKSVTLCDGTIIEEKDLIEQSRDPSRLVEILGEMNDDNFYGWNRIIKPLVHRLDKAETKELIEISLDKVSYVSDVNVLVEHLRMMGDTVGAEHYARKVLSASTQYGRSAYYDGGSRLGPYQTLVKVEEKYRSEALNNFVEDFRQGFKPDSIAYEIKNFISIFWEEAPFEELWPEIREHIFQLREFSNPAIEIPGELSLETIEQVDINYFLVDYLFETLEMPQMELRSDALKAIICVFTEIEFLQEYLEQKIYSLLSGNIDQQLLGMAVVRCLGQNKDKLFVEKFKSVLQNLLASDDMSVRSRSKDILDLIGEDTNIKFDKNLPLAYTLILPPYLSSRRTIPDSILEPGAIFPNTNDPLELVGVAKEALDLISESTKIPLRNLVERCTYFMREKVAVEDWNSDAERQIQSYAQNLGVKTAYRRPRAFASFIGLGHLVAELYDADVINKNLLHMLEPYLHILDLKMFIEEPIAANLSPSRISLSKDSRSSKWVEEKPDLSESPPSLDNKETVIGFVTESELPQFERPSEFIVGCILPANINKIGIERNPEQMIAGRMMSAWWKADHYPDNPYLSLALKDSMLIRTTLRNRAEFGSVSWLAINPIIAKFLGWSLSDKGLFRWVNGDGDKMVESKWWQLGRLGRLPLGDGVRSSGWYVSASEKGYSSLKEIQDLALWGNATVKKYDSKKHCWCSFSYI